METPYLPKSVFEKDFENVYEPAEDTFLLLDTLEKDLDELKGAVQICVECGSGSGTVITALSKTFSKNGPNYCTMIATDINPQACRTTKKCALFHKQDNIEVVRTNLADALVDRLENKVDLLIFNPPYVPTELSEIQEGNKQPLYHSWAGGSDGRRLIDTFLKSNVTRLLSKPRGVAYLVALEANKIDEICNYLTPYDINGFVVAKRKAGCELLSIIKYKWSGDV